MSPWLKAAAPALIITGAFAKACVLLDANVAMLTITTVVCLALACYVYVTGKSKQAPAGFVVALSLVAAESLLYGFSVILQFAVIPCIALYLVYYSIDAVYIGAWAVLRIAIVIATAPQSDQIYWQLAQVALLVGLAVAKFKHKLTESKHAFAIGFCIVAAALLYSGIDTLPQDMPIVLIAVPITFLLASVVSYSDNTTQPTPVAAHADNLAQFMAFTDYFVVFALLCICFVYPFDALQRGEHAPDCLSFANTVPCGQTQFSTQISAQCCCKLGYIQMPGRLSCVRAECQSNLLANSDRDCCKIKRNQESDKYLHGPYQCLCNNEPGTTEQNTFDFEQQKCICKGLRYGPHCEFI